MLGYLALAGTGWLLGTLAKREHALGRRANNIPPVSPLTPATIFSTFSPIQVRRWSAQGTYPNGLGRRGAPPAGPPVATPGSRRPDEYRYDQARRALEAWRQAAADCASARRLVPPSGHPYRAEAERELADCRRHERALWDAYWKARLGYRESRRAPAVSMWSYLFRG